MTLIFQNWRNFWIERLYIRGICTWLVACGNWVAKNFSVYRMNWMLRSDFLFSSPARMIQWAVAIHMKFVVRILSDFDTIKEHGIRFFHQNFKKVVFMFWVLAFNTCSILDATHKNRRYPLKWSISHRKIHCNGFTE